MTMRYAHLAPAHQLAAVERLASAESFRLAPAGADEGTEPAEPSDTTSNSEIETLD
jgi:hypothetical protein